MNFPKQTFQNFIYTEWFYVGNQRVYFVASGWNFYEFSNKARKKKINISSQSSEFTSHVTFGLF